ncbi:MAG: YkgJ family cysteine cluster protein [bacterium]|nr:YkgJ family cysteine cluster protein [bacterium]
MSVSSFTAILVDDSPVRESTLPDHCAVIDIKPESLGRLIGSHVVVSDGPADLGDLVPLARSLAMRIGPATVKQAVSEGANIPCKKGCAACCRYMVPLSAPEALVMGREIGSLSETSDATTRRALTNAANRILGGWSDSPFSKTDINDENGETGDIEAIGQWYASLETDCPFLSEGQCTIYDKRPLACREHVVSGIASHCEGYKPGYGNKLEMPATVLDALAQLAADLEQTEPQAIMMPLVPFWYTENRHRLLRTWPGRELATRFLDCLSKTTPQIAVDITEAA